MSRCAVYTDVNTRALALYMCYNIQVNTHYTMQATRAQVRELRELLEDTLEYYCDEHMISGEVAWTITEVMAIAKLAQLQGHVA